jgi:predicted RNA binding protein YcfA (HicA-like mRNA interferase family)
VRLPRDLSGAELGRRLAVFGYAPTRQSGSHMRFTSTARGSVHHVTIPNHPALRVGTLAAILGDVADYLGLSRAEVVDRIAE